MVTQVKRSKNRADLRMGFTTGACAAAASRAACRYLMTAQPFESITITLPNGDVATFALHQLYRSERGVVASIIKDAGDDPDCTHGAEIISTVNFRHDDSIVIDGGLGVARVTLPGLELPVGEAAINPVPKRNITDMVKLERSQFDDVRGFDIEISVPDGEERAKETSGPRLGLIGGISILGTRGTVKPYSTSAYAASVRQAVQVAVGNGQSHLMLTTGSRSEKSAMAMWPQYTDLNFVQAGDFIGVGLRAAKRYKVEKITLVAMIGKLGKLVAGHMMTHVSGKAIDFEVLAALAIQSGCSSEFVEQVKQANTGRHVLDIWKADPQPEFLTTLCQETAQHAADYVKGEVNIEVRLIDFNGDLLAKAECLKTVI